MYRKTMFFVGFAVLALQLSCGDPVGISSDVKTLTPEATEINATIIGDNLHVQLTLLDPIVLADDERIPVMVRTTSNDVELVMTRPPICDANGAKYVCGTVLIGARLDDLPGVLQRLDEFDAIHLSTQGFGTVARAFFPYGAIEDILAVVGGWPGVRYVERDPVAFVVRGAPGGEPTPMTFFGVMAFSGSGAEPYNLRIEVGVQDSLTVEYGGPPGAPSLSQSLSIR